MNKGSKRKKVTYRKKLKLRHYGCIVSMSLGLISFIHLPITLSKRVFRH